MTRWISLALALTATLGLAVAACSKDVDCDSSPSPACGGGSGPGTTTSSAGGGGGSAPVTFPCKKVMCTHGKEACLVTSMFDENDVGSCEALPAACVPSSTTPQPDCTCYGTLPDGCTCQVTADGDLNKSCNVTQ